MPSKFIQGIELKMESRPYIDCLYSVLTCAGRFDMPKYMLSGMTGFAFIFSVHKELIVASTEMYGLKTRALDAMDILGYYTEVYNGLKWAPTFPLYQQRAIIRAKESLDSGMSVIVWDPGVRDFGVIFGYDDEDGAFFYKDRYSSEEHVLLYSNLGKVEAVFWMCQIIGDRIERDIRDIYLDSLEHAVDIWETQYLDEHVHNKALASGRKAYEYLISGMERDDLNELGACKLMYYNVIARDEAFRYLEVVKEEIPECSQAYSCYRELNEIYKEIKRALPPHPVPGQEFKLDRKQQLPRLLELCRLAMQTEEAAVGELKLLLHERLNNRFVDLLDVKKFK